MHAQTVIFKLRETNLTAQKKPLIEVIMKTLFISAFASAILVAGIAYADVALTTLDHADTSVVTTR